MEIEGIRHKALRKLAATGLIKGLIEPERILDMISFIAAAADFAELAAPPDFGFHSLSGNRRSTYAMIVTKNWRLTFTRIDDATITDLDLEDYH